jgi:hypothetical protein
MFKEVVSLSLWVTWAMTSIVVALAGPFGTFDSQPFVWRLTYWGSLIAAAILIAISCRTIWRHILTGRPEWQEDLAVAISLAVTFGPLVIFLNHLVGGSDAYQAMSFWVAIGCIFIIAIGIIAFRRALRDLAIGEQPKPQVRRDRLLNRIPANPNARLARISSDNHHIKIMTDDGQEHRILMRLGDAVQETDVEPGFCVHRSHWVSQAVVVGVKTVGGRDFVQLNCGSEVPVGPKYCDNLSFAQNLNA